MYTEVAATLMLGAGPQPLALASWSVLPLHLEILAQYVDEYLAEFVDILRKARIIMIRIRVAMKSAFWQEMFQR